VGLTQAAPSGSDCTGGHSIQRKGDPRAKTSHEKSPEMCGSGHELVLKHWRDESTHGALWVSGKPDAAGREGPLNGRELQLRAKEFDLLTAFAQHKGTVLDRERLLRLVWGTDYYGDSRTIDVHVAWLRDKLGESSVKIQTVWGVGYKLVVEDAGESPS